MDERRETTADPPSFRIVQLRITRIGQNLVDAAPEHDITAQEDRDGIARPAQLVSHSRTRGTTEPADRNLACNKTQEHLHHGSPVPDMAVETFCVLLRIKLMWRSHDFDHSAVLLRPFPKAHSSQEGRSVATTPGV